MTPKYIPGSQILSSEPFAYFISAKSRNKVCEKCFQPFSQKGGIPCQECEMVSYCSKGCQNSDDFHSHSECSVLKRLGCLRFFIEGQGKKMEDFTEVVPGRSKLRTFADLMDHAADIKSDSSKLLLEHWVQLSMLLPRADMPSWDTFISIYGRILVNSFSLKTDRLSYTDTIGSGLFLAASIFDHSCSPNAAAFFKGNRLCVIATEEIETLDDVRVCYVSLLSDTATRNENLKAIWYFTCNCNTCRDVGLDWTKHSMSCGKCGSPRPVDIKGKRLRDHKKGCGHCGGGRVKEHQDSRLGRYLEVQQRVERLKGKEHSKGMAGGRFEEELGKYFDAMEGIFHAKDELFLHTAIQLHQWNHARRDWNRSWEYGSKAVQVLRSYVSPFNDSLSLLYFCLGQAALNLSMVDEAQKYLRLADANFKTVPGEDHPFYKLDLLPLLLDAEKRIGRKVVS